MHENDRPTVPGQLGGKRRPGERPGDIQPFPGRDVGDNPADQVKVPPEKAPGKARGPSQEEPLTDQPAVEGP